MGKKLSINEPVPVILTLLPTSQENGLELVLSSILFNPANCYRACPITVAGIPGCGLVQLGVKGLHFGITTEHRPGSRTEVEEECVIWPQPQALLFTCQPLDIFTIIISYGNSLCGVKLALSNLGSSLNFVVQHLNRHHGRPSKWPDKWPSRNKRCGSYDPSTPKPESRRTSPCTRSLLRCPHISDGCLSPLKQSK